MGVTALVISVVLYTATAISYEQRGDWPMCIVFLAYATANAAFAYSMFYGGPSAVQG